MNELSIKPSIQHFRIVVETEDKIRSFVESFIKSKLVGLGELLEEERTRWLIFRTRGMSIKNLSKELVEKLNIYHYKNDRVYFIYPSIMNLDYGYGYTWENRENDRLLDLQCWLSNIRIFKSKEKEILKLINEGVIIPIRKADYTEDGWSEKSYYKQEDYIRKYHINLDWFEKKYTREIESFKEYAKNFNSIPHYYITRYVVNKYGQPIPIVADFKEERPDMGMKAAKIEIDHKKGYLNIITDVRYITCVVSIDIKTNSLVTIKRLPAKKFNVYDDGL